MPRLTKIYTRKGDDGTTALGSRQRVPKESPAWRATAPWTNSTPPSASRWPTDWLRVSPKRCRSSRTSCSILVRIFALLKRTSVKYQIPLIEDRHVENLEAIIDELNPIVGRLENFILPGGISRRGVPPPGANRLPARGA